METGNKLLDELFQHPSECAFDRDQAQVCSPPKVLEIMSSYVQKHGSETGGGDKSKHATGAVDQAERLAVLSKMEEMLNCNSESCILDNKDFAAYAATFSVDVKEVISKYFKPSGPATNFNLLNNYNIDEVLAQLVKKFPRFLHIPFQMRDFEKVGSELAKIDLAAEFKKNIDGFGVVLNTDWSRGNGIHWYCIYGEKKNNKITLEYFNSSGKAPLPETQAWLQKTKHKLEKELKIPVEITYSTGVQFQNDEHSCGVYCLMYIWLRLEGVQRTWFSNKTFNDDIMHRARRVLFSANV